MAATSDSEENCLNMKVECKKISPFGSRRLGQSQESQARGDEEPENQGFKAWTRRHHDRNRHVPFLLTSVTFEMTYEILCEKAKSDPVLMLSDSSFTPPKS